MERNQDKLSCRRSHDTVFRGRPLIEIPTTMKEKFFDCADGHQYYTREEFGDGSCFFHSLATLLNLNHDSSGTDPTHQQKQILSNIRHKMQCRLDSDKSNIFKCFDFMDTNYIKKLTEKQRQQLGLKLRKVIQHAVDDRWDNYWRNETKHDPSLLARVHDRKKVTKMLHNPSTWADVYMIKFAMHVLDLNVLFFNQSTSSIYCGVQGDKMMTQPTVFVMWVNNSHFQPILRLSCDGSKHPKVKGIFRYGNDRIVKHIFNVWKNQDKCHTVGLGAVLM